jgi:hypothetical protein
MVCKMHTPSPTYPPTDRQTDTHTHTPPQNVHENLENDSFDDQAEVKIKY